MQVRFLIESKPREADEIFRKGALESNEINT